MKVSEPTDSSESSFPSRGRWRQRVWWVRYLVYLGGLVLFVVATWFFFDLRGRWRLQSFEAEWRATGRSLDIRELVSLTTAEDSFWDHPLVRSIVEEEPREPNLQLDEILAADSQYDLTGDASDHRAATWRNALPLALSPYYPQLQLTRREAGARMLESLAKVSGDLEALRDATRKTPTPFPLGRLTDEEILERNHSVHLHPIGKILGRSATCRLAIGQPEAALEDIAASLRLAQHLRQEGFLIDELVASTIEVQTLQPIWEGMERQAWNAEQLRQLGALLRKSSDRDADLDALLARELAYTHFVLRLQMGSISSRWKHGSGGFGIGGGIFHPPDWMENPGFDWLNRAAFALTPTGMILENTVHRTHLNQETLLDRTQPLADRMAAEKREVETLVDRSFHDPSRLLCLQEIGYFVASHADSRILTEIACIAIAAERQFLAEGTYPTDGKDLVPRWLPRLPEDPWSGGGVVYRLGPDHRPVVYSVGRNGRDDGGEPRRRKEEGDLVWRYSLPPGITPENYLD